MLQTAFHTFPAPDKALSGAERRVRGGGARGGVRRQERGGGEEEEEEEGEPSQSKSTRVIKCSMCSKVFKRSEHCVRHERSHTKERPFSCQFCNRNYARKDLVKRHERTIHADLYNALMKFDDPKYKQISTNAIGSGPQACLSLPAHANSGQSGEDGSNIRHCAISHGDNSAPHNDLMALPSRAIFSSDSNPIGTNTDTLAFSSPSRRSSLPPTDAITLDNANTPHPNAGTSLPTVDGRIRLNQSPISGSGQFDFDISNLTVPSPFEISSSIENRVNFFELEQGRNKRQRLSNSELSLKAIQTDTEFPIPASSTMLAEDPKNMLCTFDLMDVDLAMGEISNEFLFHQITQQNDRPLNSDRNIGDLFEISDAFGSGLSKPTDSSPEQPPDFISNSGTEKPVQVRLPMILKEKSESPLRLVVDDAGFQIVCADAHQRLGNDEVELPLKNRRELQHFLNGYLDSFHRHLPILHLPSLQVTQTPSPLILAICCIGALYRLERAKAQKIYLMAVKISEIASARYSYPSPVASSPSPSLDGQDSSDSMGPRPLWLMQTRILLLLYAVLGHDNANMQLELARMGIFITDYRARRSALQARSRQHAELQWHEWVENESTKRFLCAIFICSSLLVLIYDVPPGVGITQDLEFESLGEEKLWNAATAEDWQVLRDLESLSSARSIRSVMGDMLAGKIHDSVDTSPYYVSGFTALVIIHALNMYAWNVSQFNQVGIPASSDLSGVTPNTLLTNALTTLLRCREVVQLARPEGIESLWNNPEGPLLFNCEAMLRVAFTRLFLSTNMPEGIMLHHNTPDEKMRLLVDFVAAPQERTPLITKVMASMCEAFSVPSKVGYLLVQKTAAISWSVEHAVAGWGCVLLLSKWIHCLEVKSIEVPPTTAEDEIIFQVKTALDGMDIEHDENGSLAAAVVKSWAPLMTDVWVWGITTKMGDILIDLARVYDVASRRAKAKRFRMSH